MVQTFVAHRVGRCFCTLQASSKTSPGDQKDPTSPVPGSREGAAPSLHPRYTPSSKTQIPPTSLPQWYHCDGSSAAFGGCSKLSQGFHTFHVSSTEFWL